MQTKRCGNYVLETEMLAVPGTGVMLRVPVRRCLLSEHLFGQLVQTEKGKEVVRKLIFAFSHLPGEEGDRGTRSGSSVDNPDYAPLLRAALGPDLEPIHHSQCLVSRCNQSCTPGYVKLLEQFGEEVMVTQSNPGCPEATVMAEDVH